MILADTNSVDVFHTGKSWKKCRSYSGRRRGTEHLGFPLLGVIMMMMMMIMMIHPLYHNEKNSIRKETLDLSPNENKN